MNNEGARAIWAEAYINFAGVGHQRQCVLLLLRRHRHQAVVVTENMKHCLAICDQVVRYGLAMAPPPYRFRTHNRVRGSMTQFAQSVQPKAKGLA